jgi:hypothetical protein
MPEAPAPDTATTAPPDAAAGRRGRRDRVLLVLGPVVVWFGAALYQYSAFVRHPSHGVPGGPDGILYAWYFQSVSHSLGHGHLPFITTAMNAPTGVNLMWNTSVILPAVLCAPLTAAFGATVVVGWLMVLSPVLAATSAYLVLRRLSGRIAMPLVLASLYGFGPFLAGQSGHLHLILATPLLPIVVLLAHRLFLTTSTSAVKLGAWLGVVVAAMMLISEELGAMTALVGAVAVVLGAVLYPAVARANWARAARGLGVAVVVAAVLLAVPLAYQFKGPLALKHGVTLVNLPLDLAGTIRPSYLQLFTDRSSIALNHSFRANGVENTGYLGLPLILLLLVVVIWLLVRRDRFAYWWLLTFAITFVISLGSPLWVAGHRTGVVLPWDLVHRLPLLSSMVTVRFTLLLLLLVILLLLYASSRVTTPTRYRIAVAVVGLALLPLLPKHGRTYDDITNASPPAFFTTHAVDAIPADSTVLVLPIAHDPISSATAMNWQLRSNLRFRLVGGYSVFNLDGHSTYHGYLPPLATTLMGISNSGGTLTPHQIGVAKTAGGKGAIQWIVLTRHTPHQAAVARAVSSVGGCRLRPVADVLLCRLSPPG